MLRKSCDHFFDWLQCWPNSHDSAACSSESFVSEIKCHLTDMMRWPGEFCVHFANQTNTRNEKSDCGSLGHWPMNILSHPILLLSCYNNEPFPGRLNCLPIFIVKLFFSSHFCFFLHCRPGWLGIRCKQVKDKHWRVNKQSPESQHQCQHYLGQNVRPAKYWVSPLHFTRIYPLVNVDGVLVYQLVLCSLRKACF